jgi:DNA topoisomerase-1
MHHSQHNTNRFGPMTSLTDISTSSKRAVPLPRGARGRRTRSALLLSPRRTGDSSAQSIASLEAETKRHVADAGLRYVADTVPGFTRKRRGRHFAYYDRAGRLVGDRELIARIKSLAIPPAYVDVWICPDPDGHIQATARDAKGRKQYRYHPRWQAVRSAAKFERMAAFGDALPRIRRRVSALLRQPGLPRDKVLAALVQLLDITLIRVGNDEYARLNRSYGLTTLLTRHAAVDGSRLRFEFRGKSGVVHRVELRHAGLARFVHECIEMPGRELFQYVDEHGRRRGISAGDVNEFLRGLAGASFTAKDFRTWGASALALRVLRQRALADPKPTKRALIDTVRAVSERLGNTPAVCRKSYIHPRVIDAYLDQPDVLAGTRVPKKRNLKQEEALLLALLQQASRPAKSLAPAARVVRLRQRNQPAHHGDWTAGARTEGRRIAA